MGTVSTDAGRRYLEQAVDAITLWSAWGLQLDERTAQVRAALRDVGRSLGFPSATDCQTPLRFAAVTPFMRRELVEIYGEGSGSLRPEWAGPELNALRIALYTQDLRHQPALLAALAFVVRSQPLRCTGRGGEGFAISYETSRDA